MKKVYFFLAAMTSVALFSCTGDELVDTSPAPQQDFVEEIPIVFSSLNKNMTRADYTGKTAADLLGNKFVVTGYKGSQATWNDANNVKVFDNYAVVYRENTAHTTESNIANWEYVGVDRIKHAIDNGITRQSIKYWDYSAAQYNFIAWSAGKKTAIYTGTPTDGQVLVSAITPKTATGATGVAYTFTGKAVDLKDCYIADLVTVKKDGSTASSYNDPVTLKFRPLGSKVRIGIYETIPGYSVKDVKFYTAAAVDLAGNTSDDTPRLFTTAANQIYTEGTYTVYYPTVDAAGNSDNNQAHVKFTGTGTQSTIVDFGDLDMTIAEDGEKTEGKKFLGRTSTSASYAGRAEGNYYTQYLPNEAGTNLNLRVDYTLESIDGGGETIKVRGATAQVPSIYTQWKAGYAYTYLFKISDKTNGHTGVYDPTKPDDTTVNSDPAGLYPITFDAVAVNEEEDATQETITLVSTPSITTYQKGSKVVNNDEYLATTGDIYVTVNDGGGYVEVTGLAVGADVSSYYTYNSATGEYKKCGDSETAASGTKYYRLDPVLANGALQTLTGKAVLYRIPSGKTEAEVIDALQTQDDVVLPAGNIKGRSGLVLLKAAEVYAKADLDAANEYMLTNTVEYGVNGNAISVGTDQALRFKAAANTTYAFVYTKTPSTTTKDYFEPVDQVVGAIVSGFYRFAYDNAPHSYYYVDDNGTPADDTDDITTEYFDAQKGVSYFSLTSGIYKMETAFIGQGVSNLYTRSGAGTTADPYVYTIATGYAVTGTDYYYTTDYGMSYTKATNIAYESFSSTTLYTDAARTTAKTETTPANNQAYYDASGTYCVILPQQVNAWYVLDESADKVACASGEKAIAGQTYFDKYTQNNGVYYTKVIKVQ